MIANQNLTRCRGPAGCKPEHQIVLISSHYINLLSCLFGWRDRFGDKSHTANSEAKAGGPLLRDPPVIARGRTKLQVAHFKLPYSRAFFLRILAASRMYKHFWLAARSG